MSAIAFVSYGWATPRQLPLLVGVGWVGSMLPDIDSDTSKPQRLIFGSLSILLPALLIYRINWLHRSVLSVGVFWVLSALFILYPLKSIYQHFTKHRGLYHSVPAAFIYGALCGAFAHHEDAKFGLQVAIAGTATLGYLTHLILDEMWAIDFNGRLPSRKRSFGTALSWRGKSKSETQFLYLITFLALRLWWCRIYDTPFIPEDLNTILEAWSSAGIELFSELSSGER